MTKPTSGAPDAARLQVPLSRVLRPLVRMFIRCGITFPALCGLLRELYVNVAEYDFALPAKEQTDSRVSLLTGIHRKEVARLRGAGAPVSVIPTSMSRTSRILARWLSADEFTDDKGQPLALVRTGEDAANPSFEMLVASVTRDVRPRAVLDEWIDRAIVAIDSDDRVVLTEAAFVPAGGSDQQLYYFGRNLHDHVAAAVANVLGESPRFMERAVHYDGLSRTVAEHLEARSRDIAMDALKLANKEANAACAADGPDLGIDPDKSWRWNFGVYVYREDASAQPGAPRTAPGGTPETDP